MTNSVQRLNEILSKCKLNAACVRSFQHRHFVYYDLELEPGCRINKIRNFLDEIAVAMRATSLPLLKPLPSEGVIRLQMTHSPPETIQLDAIYRKSSKPTGVLPFVLGETDQGQPLWVEMAKNPHLLVAGSTGSGKSILLHNLIYNALRTRSLELCLVDTKLVEFAAYLNLPKVRTVAQSYSDTLALLEKLCQTMEQRYQYLKHYGLSSIEDNHNIFPKILLIIDEAADLMLSDQNKTFEKLLVKLAAKSRAAGIYIVLATQRPSVNVITGLIKANFPARLACKVASRTDSQVILDQAGAENLYGRGDALFKNPVTDTTRLQIAFSNAALNVKIPDVE